eukprot:TRINITY_DN5414_c0_g2_i1.p2 TRINITY_DN5414_c0_g2~~TRINITY_DN5414_c0_g2_i1.p2  ORF type:complete len:426 (+),score=37.12 TRINITY_DN5414_c0_g2_i1:187-1278(+)
MLYDRATSFQTGAASAVTKLDYAAGVDALINKQRYESGDMLGRIPCVADLMEDKKGLETKGARQGPRNCNEGIDGKQGILCILRGEARELFVAATMLAAGFIIGRGGQSISYISRRTRALITSYNKNIDGRKVRIFHIKGDEEALYLTIKIMMAAVYHYKDLVEGKYYGVYVDKVQIVEGIPFYYEPPPLENVPLSARTNEAQVMKASASITYNSPHLMDSLDKKAMLMSQYAYSQHPLQQSPFVNQPASPVGTSPQLITHGSLDTNALYSAYPYLAYRYMQPQYSLGFESPLISSVGSHMTVPNTGYASIPAQSAHAYYLPMHTSEYSSAKGSPYPSTSYAYSTGQDSPQNSANSGKFTSLI